jgi:hypothetical protein
MALPRVLERTALCLAALGVVLRWLASGAVAGTGFNLFIHLLFWVAPALWLLGRALAGGGAYRFTGAEFAVVGFGIVSLASALGASYRLAALNHAMAYLSFGLLLLFAVQALGPGMLLGLLLPTTFALGVYAVLQVVFHFPGLLSEYDPAAHGPLTEEMERRIRTNEVFATFPGPNQFAGFLALALPVAAGRLLDVRGAGLRLAAPPAAAIALGLLSLVWTGSLGGWVALGAGAASFAALACTRSRLRTTAVIAGASVAGVAALLLLFGPLLGPLARRSPSMHARAAYWEAGKKIVAEAPILGVGLDNFQEHYFRVKGDVQQESTKAHNDYLQVFAETGALGLAALLALLGLALRRALSAKAGTLPEGASPPRWVLPAAGAGGFLMAWAAGFLDAGSAVIAGAGWLAYAWAARGAEGPVAGWTRIGAAAGLAALLVHMGVDFDFYEMGLALGLYVAAALALLLGGGGFELRLSPRACGIGAGVLLLVAAPLLVLAAPRAIAADAEIREARRALYELEAGARKGRSVTRLLSDALRHAEAACEHNPFEAGAHGVLAEARREEWQLLHRPAPREAGALLRLQQLEGGVLQALENWIAVRPLHSPAHDAKAQMHRALHRFYSQLPAGSPDPRLLAREHLSLALRHQRRALELYPTLARNAYHTARLLDLSGERGSAPELYAQALRLSDRSTREPFPVARLRLAAAEEARCLVRLGREEEARARLAARFRERRPAPRELEEEMDEEMGPVIRGVLEAILKHP